MNITGQKPLARTCLTKQQHGQRGRCKYLTDIHHMLHDGMGTDDSELFRLTPQRHLIGRSQRNVQHIAGKNTRVEIQLHKTGQSESRCFRRTDNDKTCGKFAGKQ